VTGHVSLTGADAAPEKDLGVESRMKNEKGRMEVTLFNPAAKDMLFLSVLRDNFSKLNPAKKGEQSLLCPSIHFVEHWGLSKGSVRREDRLTHGCLLFAG